jgi:hypothetical protein
MSDTKAYYTGIYGDNSISLVRNLINVARIEEKGKYYDWHIKQHVHPALFQLFIVEQGSLEILFDDGAHYVEAPAYFTVPKNVLHEFKLEPGMSGWVISLADGTLENMLKLDADIIFAIDAIQIVKLDLDNVLIADAYATMHKCINEFNSSLPAKNLALQYLVGMLLLRLYRIPASAIETVRVTENSDKIYYRRFMQLLKEANSPHKSVEEYVAAMGITHGHLSRVCKHIAGKSPKVDKILSKFYKPDFIEEIKINTIHIL